MALVLNLSRLRMTQAKYYGKPPGGGGTGSVTNIASGNGITAVPNPLVTTGHIDLGPLTSDWNAGNYQIHSQNSGDNFNLTAFGANPNGVFDNTAVLNAAIAAIPAAGGTILLPEGTCYVASTITISKPVSFKGQDGANCQLYFANNLDGLVYTHTNNKEIVMEDVQFGQIGPGPATAGSIIKSASVANFPFHINRCTFNNHFVALNLESTWLSSINDCRFVAGATAGSVDIYINNLVNMDQGNIRIHGCAFLGNATYNILQDAGGGSTIESCYFITPAGFNVASIYLALTVAKTTGDLLIDSCNFEGSPSTASIIVAPSGTFTNILIQNNEIASFPSVTAIQVKPTATGKAHYGLISNNTMWQGDYGVEFAPAAAGAAESWRIDGNMFSEQVIAAIKLPAVAANLTELEIGENTFLKAGGAVYVSGAFSTSSGFQKGHFQNIAIAAEDWTPTDKMEVVGENANSAVTLYNYQNTSQGASLYFRATPGTIAAPSAIQADECMAWIAGSGYDGSTFPLSQVGIGYYAAENWSGTNQGTYINFWTTPIAGTGIAEIARFNDKGYFGLNTTTPTRTFDLGGTQRFRGIAAPAVSEANSGTLYFDSASNTLKASLNGGAYVDVIGSAGLTGSGTATKIGYWTAATTLAGAANIYTDAVNHRLGIKVAAPAYQLDVDGDINITTGSVVRQNALTVFRNDTANNTVTIGTGISTAMGLNTTAFGKAALAAATAASNACTAMGVGSLTLNTDGVRNTAVGSAALGATTTGGSNVGIGREAGIANTTGSDNVFIGADSTATAGNLTNAVAIGKSAVVGASNSMVLGDANMKVGIRISTPAVSLDVAGALATRHYDITLVNGLNSDIALLDSSWARIIGPTGVFSVGGFTNGTDGRHLWIRNTVAFQMTIVNADASSAATNQILTPTGGDVTASVAHFIYEDAADLWILVDYH